jgi:alginate O-acetyltransferase complex protein AlgI
MLFNTIDFIIFFVIILTTLVLVRNRKFHHIFLLLASYFFLYYSNNYFIVLLIISTVLDFYIAQGIAKSNYKKHKKLLLIFSLAVNLGILGFFKYADFAITQFNIFGNFIDLQQQIPVLEIFLPIGISFYTFQTIGYTIDVYRGHIEPRKSFLDFALFVAFFPQLVAGPIMRAKTFFPQMTEKFGNPSKERLRQIILHNTHLKFGISLMAIGFFKKMFFADNIAPLVNDVFSSPIGSESLTIILGSIGFSIQVYGDFSGYSDIAIGAAMILGIKIPPNFNKPFFAKTPAEFWKRWHISLSSWVRDYLYFPLIWSKKNSRLRISLGIIISMTLLGVWHGTGWNFVLFGFAWGIVLASHQLILSSFPQVRKITFFKTRMGTILSIIVTQYITLFTFMIFRVPEFDELFYSMQKFVILDFQTENTFELIKSHEIAIVLMIIFVILHFISFKMGNLPERISNLKHRYWFIFILIIALLILLSYGGNAEQFVYFQF